MSRHSGRRFSIHSRQGVPDSPSLQCGQLTVGALYPRLQCLVTMFYDALISLALPYLQMMLILGGVIGVIVIIIIGKFGGRTPVGHLCCIHIWLSTLMYLDTILFLCVFFFSFHFLPVYCAGDVLFTVCLSIIVICVRSYCPNSSEVLAVCWFPTYRQLRCLI